MDKIIESLVTKAKYFIKEFGEFYPFATALGADEEIEAVAIQMNDERPDPSAVQKALEQAMQDGLSSGTYKMAGMCTDVFYTLEGQKSEALELRIISPNEDTVRYYFLYERGPHREIIMKDLVKDLGQGKP